MIDLLTDLKKEQNLFKDSCRRECSNLKLLPLTESLPREYTISELKKLNFQALIRDLKAATGSL
jgi:hypothetical protein